MLTDDVALDANSGTVQMLSLPLVLAVAAGAATEQPREMHERLRQRRRIAGSQACNQVVRARGFPASVAKGKAGSEPSRPSNGIRCVATAKASPVAVPDEMSSLSFSRESGRG